jgi:hypothetical protein
MDGTLDPLKNERFHLPPAVRIPLTTALSFVCGMVYGLHSNYGRAGTQYLIENSHRLPKTKGGWYWYYKRKNWVCLQAAVKGGVKSGAKTGLFTFMVFSLEALIDKARGRVDCLSTITTSIIMGTAYSQWKGLNKKASMNVLKKGFVIGIVGGVLQDALMMARGGDTWRLPVRLQS